MIMIPGWMDLRNVPALSNRLLPRLTPKEAALWTSNSAPARLVRTALEFIPRFPSPVQRTVPPFSNVRPNSAAVVPISGLISSVAPVSMTVSPLPLMIPDIHANFPRTINAPLPVNVGPLLPLPSVTSAQSAGVFNVTVTLLEMIAVSFERGARLGVQLSAVSQSPFARLVQVKTMGVNRAYTVLSFVITRVTGLLRVTMLPSQA